VDINSLIARVKAILMTPKTEWPVIAAEPATVSDLYKNYILILAALGPAATFVGDLLFGTHIPLLGTFRPSIGSLLTSLILSYGVSLLVVFIVALITDALAPNFGGEKNKVQALKAAAYSATPGWVVGILHILPGVGALVWLLGIAAAVYGVYLLYLGLPHTMKTTQERSTGYAIAIIVVGFVLNLVLMSVVGLSGRAAYHPSISLGSSDAVQVDPDSSLGKLDAWSKKVAVAGKQMEAAQKNGDADAQGKAMGAMMGAALGGGSQVEALAPDSLKPFVPETLGGLKRTDFSAERNGALGMQLSEAHATYSDGAQRNLRLEVTDMGSAKGLMALAGWAAVDSSKETDHGYDKTYKQDGRLIHEEWDSQDKRGEYGIVLGERFSVKVSGNADSINDLKAAVASVNLAGLEALKNQGVKNG
jgi:hypothetical protein